MHMGYFVTLVYILSLAAVSVFSLFIYATKWMSDMKF